MNNISNKNSLNSNNNEGKRGVEVVYNMVKDALSPTEFSNLSESEIMEKLRPLEVAYLLSKMKHAGQIRREGIRYFEHIKGVTTISLRELPGSNFKRALISLLHDIVEDTDITIETIENIFGTEIAEAVDLVTKKPLEYYLKGEEKERITAMNDEGKKRYEKQNRERIIHIRNEQYYGELFDSKNENAIWAKVADRLHNLRSTIGATKIYRIKEYIHETKNCIISELKKDNIKYSIGIKKLEAELENLNMYIQVLETNKELQKNLS